MDAMKSFQIASGQLVAELMPDLGGRIVSLRLVDDPARPLDVLVPLVGAPVLPPRWPKAGGYPLAPYSNRIANARLSFRGHEHDLPPHPDAIPHTRRPPVVGRGGAGVCGSALCGSGAGGRDGAAPASARRTA